MWLKVQKSRASPERLRIFRYLQYQLSLEARYSTPPRTEGLGCRTWGTRHPNASMKPKTPDNLHPNPIPPDPLSLELSHRHSPDPQNPKPRNPKTPETKLRSTWVRLGFSTEFYATHQNAECVLLWHIPDVGAHWRFQLAPRSLN